MIGHRTRFRENGDLPLWRGPVVKKKPQGGGGVLPEKLGGGVRPASQNPYPIYDQNLQYSLPYLWPDQKFETLFMPRPLHQNPVSNQHYN